MNEFRNQVGQAMMNANRKYAVKATHIIVGYETEMDMRLHGLPYYSMGINPEDGDTYMGLRVAIDRSMSKGQFRVTTELL